MKEPDPDGEDGVEPALAEVEVLEVANEELGSAGVDVLGVAPGCRVDHVRRAVDRGEPARPVQTLQDERRRDAVAAADLQHAVVGAQIQLLDDAPQALAQEDGLQT